jgi:hypothetical protein
MSVNTSREEKMRIAAEKVRRKKEKEQRENDEFYERITTGPRWLMFKIVVVFCTIMAVITTIEHLFDGPTEKITESDWQVDENWEYSGHAVLNVEGYMFTPPYLSWWDHLENSLELTYSPIFKTGKKFHYDSPVNETAEIRSYTEMRDRSIFSWFPFFQLFLLVPFVTFLLKRQSPWFNFARIVSFVFVFPGMLIVMFFTMI